MVLNRLGAALLLVAFVSGWVAAQGHDHAQHIHGQNAGELGSVNFPVSCTATAQTTFSRSVAMLHSFWYEEAAKSFESRTARSNLRDGLVGRGHELLPSTVGAAHVGRQWQKALRRCRKRKPWPPRPSVSANIFTRSLRFMTPTRSWITPAASAYSDAMERVYRQNPGDSEAAVFYALSLVASASHTDKRYANQRQAGAILEKVFATEPNHPGVIHYLIHSYDYPSLASHGLDAARRYAKIAPAVPHALHMPSHIFVRLGLWDDAVHSNRAAIDAGKKYEQETHMGAAWDQRLHPTDYLVYSLLQSGRDSEAQALVEEVRHSQKLKPDNLTGGYVLAVVPARYAM